MPALFKRRCSVILVPPIPGTLQAPPTAQGVQINDLRMQFKIEKTLTKEPNTAEIQIFNLSQASRAKMQGRGTRVVLLAGYDAGISQVFSGESRTIDHVRDGADWITKIQCGDGERNFRFALVNESFKPGAAYADALKKAVTALAVDPGNSGTAFAGVVNQFVSGYAMQGKASVALDSMLSSVGLEWSIQDGVMQVLAPGVPAADSAVLVNAQSGLIGSPSHGSPEKLGGPGVLKFKMLLQPLIRPGRLCFVQWLANLAGGNFRAEKVTHTGDTNGGEWFTTVEARAL